MNSQKLQQLEERLASFGAIYALAREERHFEIAQLVQRNNFFMVFQGVFLAGFLQSANSLFSSSSSYLSLVLVFISFFGVCISWLQMRLAAGAKFWQERWELEVEGIEKEYQEMTKERWLLKFLSCLSWRDLFVNVKKKDDLYIKIKKRVEDGEEGRFVSRMTDELINNKPSPSRIPIYVGFCFVVFWMVVLGVAIARFTHGVDW